MLVLSVNNNRSVVTFLVISLLLGGCAVSTPTNVSFETSPVQSIQGVVSESGGKFLILSGKKSIEITSRKLDLKQYVGQQVTVTGEYSGTTLYVDEVKP